MIRHSGPGTFIAFVLLLALTSYSPLMFGSVLLRDRLILAAGSGLVLALLALMHRDPDRGVVGAVWQPARVPALALAAIGGFGLLQSVSWPRPLVRSIAPRLVEFWDSSRALLDLDAATTVPLSLSPAVSRLAAVEWLAIAAVLLVASVFGRQRGARRLFLLVLLLVALFEVLYGADQWLQRRPTIWGIEVAGDPGRLRGTFVNPNHFAFFLALPAAACFAWLWWSVRRLRYLAAPEWQLLYVSLPSLVFLVLAVGIAFSGSRGGLVALGGALIGQTLFLMVHYRSWRGGWLGGLAILLGGGGVLLFGWRSGLGRFFETSAYDIGWSDRLRVYGHSLELWRLFPWSGSGLGTFRQAFPLVHPPGLEKTWVHAHNDLLEVLVLTGVFGVLAIGVGLVALVRRLWTVFQRGRRSEDRAAALAALGALLASLLHSLVDFGLAVPANAWTLAVLCGLACGAPVLPPAGVETGRESRHRGAGDA